MENARNDAYQWALSNTDETMAVIANAGFEHPCELVVRNGTGMIHMRASPLRIIIVCIHSNRTYCKCFCAWQM